MNIRAICGGLGIVTTLLFSSACSKEKINNNSNFANQKTSKDIFIAKNDSIIQRQADDKAIRDAKNLICDSLDAISKRGLKTAKKIH